MNGVVIDLVLVDDVELGSVAACGGKWAVNQLSNFDPGSVAVIRPVAQLSVSVNRPQLVHIWWVDTGQLEAGSAVKLCDLKIS